MDEEKKEVNKGGRPRNSPRQQKQRMICVRLNHKMIRTADKMVKVVAKRMPYSLPPTRSDVLRVALDIGLEQLAKEV